LLYTETTSAQPARRLNREPLGAIAVMSIRLLVFNRIW
jgi:hypothetical protein